MIVMSDPISPCRKISQWSARHLSARCDDDSMNRENANPYQPIVDLNAGAAREIMDNAANVAIDCWRGENAARHRCAGGSAAFAHPG
jgi:hypothetical protein